MSGKHIQLKKWLILFILEYFSYIHIFIFFFLAFFSSAVGLISILSVAWTWKMETTIWTTLILKI